MRRDLFKRIVGRLRLCCKRWWYVLSPMIYYWAEKDEDVKMDARFVKIGSFSEFREFMNMRRLPVENWQVQRFLNDKTVSFVALADDKDVLSSGWISQADRNLLEGHEHCGERILFDFATPVKHQHKGYYTRLLRSLIADGGGLIYAKSCNRYSRRAIESVGFRRYC